MKRKTTPEKTTIKKRLYAIRDAKAGVFNPPCIFDNDAVAVRSFGDLVLGDKQSMIAMHPADFALCYLGEFDVELGMLIPAEGGFKSLAIGSDYAKGE